MPRHSTFRRTVASCLIALLSIGQAAPAWGGDWMAQMRARWDNHNGVPSAEALALEIQELEKHIDRFGTIVAKQPDVWGQARLMKHRGEFEKQLFKELGGFKDTLQGSISRSDQAFLASAFSLSAAISGSPAVMLPQTASVSREIATRQTAALKASGVASPTPAQLAGVTSPTPIAPPTSNDAAGLTDNFDTPGVIQRSTVSAASTGVNFAPGSNISLEPTEHLDQLATYINHLHQIRRLNEGDDTSASPGYALHLIRIPVSVLPGSKTRKGYGAEMTMTATPYLGRDLLPATFRTLVINDIVEQIATPLAEYFNSMSSRKAFAKLREERLGPVKASDAEDGPDNNPGGAPPSGAFGTQGRLGVPASGITKGISPTRSPAALASRPPAARVDPSIRRTSQATPLTSTITSQPGPTFPSAPVPAYGLGRWNDPSKVAKFNKAYVGIKRGVKPPKSSGIAAATEKMQAAGTPMYSAMPSEMPPGLIELEQKAIGQALMGVGISVPAIRSRNARYAFPVSQSGEVYGGELILPVTYQAFDVVLAKPTDDSDEPPVVQYQKVAGYVQDQVTAAYDFLSRPNPEIAGLWMRFATPELATAVQSRDVQTLRNIRAAFLGSLPNSGIDDDSPYGPNINTTTAAFAWAILVESVLLNEQLIKDVHEAATAKGELTAIDHPLDYHLPCPTDEARDAFNAYVKTRFPIHVFALDPFVEEQNIADELARSRETQLALSLAFVTGNLSASSMTRFARRLELQTSTIAVNRTQLAFSHGEDTFGWRFQPRYQTPPIQNNLAAFAQTLGGGPTRDGDRRQLELEPGPRECVALVIMPSFVPYVTFETRSNWYRLTSPKHTEVQPLDFLKMSASIKRAYQLAQAVCDAGLYRDGDIARLVNRVKQLSAELPMQSMISQVPYENTHGGFELFNVGITDLAPELRSWYGIPGVSKDNPNLVFLVGDNFSVVASNVVAGNRAVDPDNDGVTLLSKQVMSVTIPAGAQTVMHGGVECVEVSVATPYGVSQPLYIPTYTPKDAKPAPATPSPTFTWSTPLLQLAYKFDAAGVFEGDKDDPTANPRGGLSIALDSGVNLNFNDKSPTTADLTLTFAAPDKDVKAIQVHDVPYNPDTAAFEITGDIYKKMKQDLFDQDHFGGAFSDAKDSLPHDVTVARTAIRLRGATGPLVPEDVSNTLTIKWRKVPTKADAAAPAPPTPAAPAPGN